ncbi:hypothetical protein SOHN41_03244 [Shewanella sp. HN-41]|nr:hypothetical protein SOHN41_03244 [Shewanella sp. HN-41]
MSERTLSNQTFDVQIENQPKKVIYLKSSDLFQSHPRCESIVEKNAHGVRPFNKSTGFALLERC